MLATLERYRIKPRQSVGLDDWDPAETSAFSGKKENARRELEDLRQELEAQQELLFAEHKHKVLVVLQGRDASGKDGVIRRVFDGVNPQGVRVARFVKPTPEELDHDFLWRVHKQVPGAGEMVIFNRSHYEGVLVERVHNLVPEEVWRRRYGQINEFERSLWQEGTTVLKFLLHIDADEQKQRLMDRLEDPAKHWKFNPGDLDERKLWKEYTRAYEDAIENTSTEWAPWHVVPANRSWYRDLVVSRILVDALKKLDMRYPPLSVDPRSVRIP